MKRTAIFAVLAASALASHAQTFVDRARVERVDPQFETVQIPRQECSTQIVTEAAPAQGGGINYGGALIGGVAGGLLGNQVGKGHGREAATAVGAVVGAFTGNQLAGSQAQTAAPQQREVRECRTVYDTQQRVTGYRVTYQYHGQAFTTMTRNQPGETIPVRLSVTPIDER
jgi:uncharacterized protein YcfJ